MISVMKTTETMALFMSDVPNLGLSEEPDIVW